MFSYEVNLICDGEHCSEILVSEPQATNDEAVIDVVAEAVNLGWKRHKTCWYCPRHVEEKWGKQ